MIDVLMSIFNNIWKTGEWSTPWTQSVEITPPNQGNFLLYKTGVEGGQKYIGVFS